MLIEEIVRVAFQAVRANKLRSLLTMLGIIIGVGAVITMVALGAGARKAVEARIHSLGPTLLTIEPGQSYQDGVASAVKISLTVDDYSALLQDARYFDGFVPELNDDYQVQYGSTNINVGITGTTPDYGRIKGYTVTTGRMFTVGDDDARRRVAVLGADVPDLLKANAQTLLGSEIQIRGIPFEVVGILSEKGTSGSGRGNPDNDILIPLQTARYRVIGSDRLHRLTGRVVDLPHMNLAMIEVERVLRRAHKIPDGRDNDFEMSSQSDLIATFQETTATFSFLLASVAAVSLLVGGIGIMNIMLVSVTERTREIGVRMAIGASRRSILLQFMVEALVLCMGGGLLGVIVGTSGALLLSALAQWNTAISLYSILVAFAFSASIGLFFGIWPARRAAALDPIVALRYE
ncbi:MAG TPA: ABC transporter permease [Gemmatimonadales bacterium]|nr:ABC transporter permease [Gemmatimonadales bacterium]